MTMKKIELYVTGSFGKTLVYDIAQNKGNKALKQDILDEVKNAYAVTAFGIQALPTDPQAKQMIIEKIESLFA
jgi:hypothetical protein